MIAEKSYQCVDFFQLMAWIACHMVKHRGVQAALDHVAEHIHAGMSTEEIKYTGLRLHSITRWNPCTAWVEASRKVYALLLNNEICHGILG